MVSFLNLNDSFREHVVVKNSLCSSLLFKSVNSSYNGVRQVSELDFHETYEGETYNDPQEIVETNLIL